MSDDHVDDQHNEEETTASHTSEPVAAPAKVQQGEVRRLTRISLSRIFLLAVFVTLFLASILLNVSYFSNSRSPEVELSEELELPANANSSASLDSEGAVAGDNKEITESDRSTEDLDENGTDTAAETENSEDSAGEANSGLDIIADQVNGPSDSRESDDQESVGPSLATSSELEDDDTSAAPEPAPPEALRSGNNSGAVEAGMRSSSMQAADYDQVQAGLPVWLLIPGLIILSMMSLTWAFWHYYTRAVYLKDGPALVPERWHGIIAEIVRATQQSQAQTERATQRVSAEVESQSQRSEALLESFLTLQRSLDAKDDEIERLKEGYDAKIFKKFLFRFIRVDRALREMRDEFEGQEGQRNYEYLSRMMEDALEECGVERFIPEIGDDIREAGPEIADEPEVIGTTDPAQDFRIVAVNTVGYRLEGEDGNYVIVPSRVTIYRASRQEGTEA